MKKILLSIFLMSVISGVDAQNQLINGNLQLNNKNEGGIRIGKVGEGYITNVPIGGITAKLYIDFSGYRDIAVDQIGARIAAIRYNKHQDNKAYIQNTSLVFYTNNSGLNTGTADLVERMRISPSGYIGIGTSSPKNLLDVNGIIRAKEVKIEATGWADFVFSSDYQLQPLSEVKKYIEEKQHLPNIPSALDVKENGIDVGEMQVKLLQKIEELTLYMIELKEENQEIKTENISIRKELDNFKNK